MKHKYLILPVLFVLLASCANLVQAPAGERYFDGVYYNATTLVRAVPDYIPARRPIADTVVVVNEYYDCSPAAFAAAGFAVGAWSSFWWDPWYRPWGPWYGSPYYDPWFNPWYHPWHHPWYGPGYYDPWYRPWGPWYGPAYVYYPTPSRRNPVYGSGYTPVSHSGGLGTYDRTRGRSSGYVGGGSTLYRSGSTGDVLHPQRVGGGGSGSYTVPSGGSNPGGSQTPSRPTFHRSGGTYSSPSRSSGSSGSGGRGTYTTPSRSSRPSGSSGSSGSRGSYSSPSRSSGSSGSGGRGSYSSPSRSGGGFSGGSRGGGFSGGGGASHGRR